MKNKNHQIYQIAFALGIALGLQSGLASAEPTQESLSCRPVRKYTFKLKSELALNCQEKGPASEVFNLKIPDRGRAVARVTFRLKGYGNPNAGLHGWAAQTSFGDRGFQEAAQFGVGEDICPGESLKKSWLAFGALTDKAASLKVSAVAYRSDSCKNNIVHIAPGSQVEVWVEDEAQGCAGRDIAFSSYFKHIWQQHGNTANLPVRLNTNLSVLVGTELTSTTRATVRVLGQSEISPTSTQNKCGDRFESGAAFLGVNGSWVQGDTQGYAPSGGMTHVLLSPELVIQNAPPQKFKVQLGAAVNQTIHVGAQAGATFSGDSCVAIIVER